MFWLYACMAIQNICNQELLSRSLLTLSWSVCAFLFVYLYSSVFENVFPCFCICISLFVCLYFAVCVHGISLFLNLHSLFSICIFLFVYLYFPGYHISISFVQILADLVNGEFQQMASRWKKNHESELKTEEFEKNTQMTIIMNCRSDSEDRFQLYLDKTFNKTVKIIVIVVLIISVIMMTVIVIMTAHILTIR